MNYFYELQWFIMDESVAQYYLLSCRGDPKGEYEADELMNQATDNGRFQDVTQYLGQQISNADDLKSEKGKAAFCQTLGRDEVFRAKIPGYLEGVVWKNSDQGPLFNLVQVYFTYDGTFADH